MTIKLAKLLFLAFVVSIPLARPLNFNVFGQTLQFSEAFFILSAIFWICAIIRRETRVYLDPGFIFIAVYIGALGLSAFFSIAPLRSFVKLAGVIYLAAICFLAYNLCRDIHFLRKVIAGWVIATAIVIIGSFLGVGLFYAGYRSIADNYFLSHFGSLPSGNYPRVHSFFANANMMCNYLNVSLMLTIAVRHLYRRFRSLMLAVQVSIWIAAIFTFSVGLGGMILSSALWSYQQLQQKKRKVLATALVSAGVIMAGTILATALVSPDTPNTDQNFSVAGKGLEPSVRVLIWQNTLKTIAEHPLTGVGVGNDPVRFKYTTLSGDEQLLADAHNIWLNVTAQAGLPGLIAILALSFYLYQRCRFAVDNESSENSTILPAVSCALAGAFFYQGLTGSYEDARHLWLLFGILFAVSRAKPETDLPAGSGSLQNHPAT